MRGTEFQRSAMFSYLSPEQRVPADHPLRAIRQIIDKVLKQLSRLFSRMYSQVRTAVHSAREIAAGPAAAGSVYDPQ